MNARNRDLVHSGFGAWSFAPLQIRLADPLWCPLELLFSGVPSDDDWQPESCSSPDFSAAITDSEAALE